MYNIKGRQQGDRDTPSAHYARPCAQSYEKQRRGRIGLAFLLNILQ